MVVVTLGEKPPLYGRLETSGFQLFESLQLIEPLDEKQISDLLDHFERIGYSSRPERIPDLVNLVANFICQHDCSL